MLLEILQVLAEVVKQVQQSLKRGKIFIFMVKDIDFTHGALNLDKNISIRSRYWKCTGFNENPSRIIKITKR